MRSRFLCLADHVKLCICKCVCGPSVCVFLCLTERYLQYFSAVSACFSEAHLERFNDPLALKYSLPTRLIIVADEFLVGR